MRFSEFIIYIFLAAKLQFLLLTFKLLTSLPKNILEKVLVFFLLKVKVN